jgi:hypothetical protein
MGMGMEVGGRKRMDGLGLVFNGEERRGLRASGSVWVTGAGTGRGGGQASTGQTDNERTGRGSTGRGDERR